MESRQQDRDERVSLAGPDPAAVLKALLRVDPEAEPADERGQSSEPSSGSQPQP